MPTPNKNIGDYIEEGDTYIGKSTYIFTRLPPDKNKSTPPTCLDCKHIGKLDLFNKDDGISHIANSCWAPEMWDDVGAGNYSCIAAIGHCNGKWKDIEELAINTFDLQYYLSK